MRPFACLALISALLSPLFAQSDRGTITGAILDPAGAVVANAPIQVKNVETGAVYQAGSSATGNYTLAQIPTGTYEMTVAVSGFKRFVRQNIFLPVAQTVRIDVSLEVGANTESVTVSEAAPLLKTESGELSHNIATNTLNSLPVLGIGANASSAGIRNPYAVVQLLPGADWRPDSSVRLNGMVSNTQALRIEGQDATNGISSPQSMTQPSVEAIQEFAIQTSNYSAEFGQAGGGVFNVTMRSGSNQLHGSAYEYFANEALNAGQPFTSDKSGHLLRNRVRRNDYGFSLGGPVYLPKLYNGHDRAFFFFNFEQFRETVVNNNTPITVPTLAYRNGDFRQALTNRNVCPAATPNCDPLGRPIFENAVYDPLTQRLAPNGQTVRDPFLNNIIPVGQIDPVAAKTQAYIPQPTSPGLVNNYLNVYRIPRETGIPSVKADYSIGPRSKVSGYWSRTETNTPSTTALPFPVTTAIPIRIVAHTIRLNFDYTIRPTLLLHLGAGLLDTLNQQFAPEYDPVAGIGLKGTYSKLFPSYQGLAAAQGGMANMGPGSQTTIHNLKPTANVSVTWVRNNHTYKAGGEMIVEGYPTVNLSFTNAWITFGPIESGLPSTNGQTLAGGTPGFPYASFLLGAPNNGFIGVPSTSRLGSHAFSWFVEDSWKVTRKLTLDYGLRYDFQTYLKEQYGRYVVFSPSTPNPSAGGRLGAVAGEGYGGGRCNCQLAHNYPWAYGPRVGLAYQITPKTVARSGAGVSYYKTNDNGLVSNSSGSQKIYNASSYGDPPYFLRNGLPYQITWPDFNPGQFPLPGTTSSPPQQLDQNAGRPARIFQWSLGLQREIARDLVVEAAYVGNRGAWWNAYWLINLNMISQPLLDHYGLDRYSASDRALLNAPVNSPIAIARGFSSPPYPGFPLGSTVSQALRPYPQFGHFGNFHWSPLGDTWYDSLQVKATKRLSHGLDLGAAFTWQKQLTIGSEASISNGGPVFPATNDLFNREQNKYFSGYDQPFQFVVAGNYTTPALRAGGAGMRALSWVSRDWILGAVMRYASGLPIMSPIASNGLREMLFRVTGVQGATGGTFMNRVPGQPLFLQDLNCHCFDPNTTFVLNPKAWVNPPPGEFGTSAAYYGDYRYQRRPSESVSLGRNFRLRERANLQIRAEFANIFNRAEPVNPVSGNALATQTRNTAGQATAGFGWISTASVFSAPRQGTLVARFTF